MNFLDLGNATEDERYQVQGILSKQSQNLEFTCAGKLKSKRNAQNGRLEATGNRSDQRSNRNPKSAYNSSSPQSNSSTDSSASHSANSSTNQSNRSNLSGSKMNGYHYNGNHYIHPNNGSYHNQFDPNDQHGSHPYSGQPNSHHYNHHHSNQPHHYHLHNSHHAHGSRIQPTPVLQSPYGQPPFIPGHLNANGPLQPGEHHAYKPLPAFYPQYAANSSKPFYPTNGHHPNGSSYTNTSLNGTTAVVVNGNQLHHSADQNGHQSTNATPIVSETMSPSYPITYPANSANAANSFMPHPYMAHPNSHYSQPMFYLPFPLPPQFYPPAHQYPSAHLAAQPGTILTTPAPHPPLATPPISPQQDHEADEESNLSSSPNCESADLPDGAEKNDEQNDEQAEENEPHSKQTAEAKLDEVSKDQTTILTNTTISNYSFLSPESMDSTEIEKEIGEEEQQPVLGEEDEQNTERAASTNITPFSSTNELNESKESNTTTERPEEMQSNVEENAEHAETGDAANPTNDLHIESISLNGHEKESDEVQEEVKSDKEEKPEETNLGEQAEEEEPKAPVPTVARSWADLFKSGKSTKIINLDAASTTGSLFSSDAFGPLGSIETFTTDDSKLTRQTIEPAPIEEDPTFAEFAKKLKELKLKHSLPLLIPCGLTNQSNWCYINAILQALLYCPGFYNLMRSISEIDHIFRPKTATPVIDSFAKFFTHFMPDEMLMRKAKQGNQFNFDDLPKREVYKPTCIYNVLGNINGECLNGRQEDAEEFLSSVLNTLHEEMLLLLNYDPKTGQLPKPKPASKATTKTVEDPKSNTSSPDSKWKEVKTKHKALATSGCKFQDTPITDIFGGTMLFIRTAGKDTSQTRQPFFSLKLDIQANKIRNVEDALKGLANKELIHGYTCPKTNKTIDATSQTYIEQLPAILILHLKLFNGEDGQTKKSMKKIEFPIDLEIPKECLTNGDRPKYSKSYKLLAVVHHDGKEAGKGHYVTDIYHIGTSSWLRCDDSKVEAISVQQLMKPQHSKIPYLLFYRRCDTLRGRESKN